MPSLNNENTALDLAALRKKLRDGQGKTYWRGLEELAETDSFQELLHREFPEQASEWTNEVTRRRFLGLMGASLALAGLTGCGQPSTEEIMPYVHQPEGLVPGKPFYFASALTLAGYATGVLVESHMGRPTKVEGNPDHPASLGASDVYGQASILGLYDPDREQAVTYLGRVRAWDDLVAELRKLGDRVGPTGKGLRILTGHITSPTVLGQLKALLGQETFADARWHVHEPALSEAPLYGTKLVYGEPLQPRYRLARLAESDPEVRADVIVALDADFLTTGPGHLRYAREFAKHRDPEGPMNRLYAVESTFTATGSMADHRLPMRSGDIEALTRGLASRLGVAGIADTTNLTDDQTHWLDALARDLQFVDSGDEKRPEGTTLVVAGDGQPPEVHALSYAINAKLGNVGKTVEFLEPMGEIEELQPGSLSDLVVSIDEGEVETLLILESNPVFSAPADLHFAEKMDKVGLRISLGLYHDETSRLCHWHIPAAHELESWGDARAFDGTASIQQPLIAPLYGGKTIGSVLAALAGESSDDPRGRVQRHWQKWWKSDPERSGTFERFWKRSLHQGTIEGTSAKPKDTRLRDNFADELAESNSSSGIELVFRPDPTIYDGRFANNGWLQELPKPVTKLTWDNAVCLSPRTAEKLGVGYAFGFKGGEHGQMIVDRVALEAHGRRLEMPICIVPGHADDSITVHLGYGRKHAGKVGTDTGFDVYQLRSSDSSWLARDVKVTKIEGEYTLACVQGHHNMEGRELIRSADLAHFHEHPDFAQHAEAHHGDSGHTTHPLTLYEPREYPGRKWEMSVNLGTCTGCNACVVACQSENNIPVVGKEEVVRGREMHWLRIDRYFVGNPFEEPEELRLEHQPVMCMHCENAPCEVVCPVAATVHSFDGLNDMVYNRCVGTRYCSNNCPYKVRRFNFFEFADYATESLKLMRNPEVTVRTVGVMEKCTYCVQRIRSAEIQAERQDRGVRDGEVLTACQSVCPTDAIVFGDANDPKSAVSKLKASPRNYGILTELNTNPATTYLAGVRNPNPAMGEHE